MNARARLRTLALGVGIALGSTSIAADRKGYEDIIPSPPPGWDDPRPSLRAVPANSGPICEWREYIGIVATPACGFWRHLPNVPKPARYRCGYVSDGEKCVAKCLHFIECVP